MSVSVPNSRRGSTVPTSSRKQSLELNKSRRQSNTQISSQSSRADLLQQPIKDTDIFYVTQYIYPSLDIEDEFSWSVCKPFDLNSPLPTSSSRNKSTDRKSLGIHSSIVEESSTLDEKDIRLFSSNVLC